MISPLAYVSPKAQIGKNVTIDAFAYIDDNVIIGDNCHIFPSAVIGAVPQDILSQIIWESVTLTLAAGSAGIVFSVLILNVVEMISGKPFFQISFWTAILAALLLTVLGVLAGLAPALRAMKIKPVDAMRDE